MINSKMIYRIIGFLLLIETAMLLCCGGVSLLYRGDDLPSFLQSAGITACVGFLLLLIGRGAEKRLGRRDGYVIVSVASVSYTHLSEKPKRCMPVSSLICTGKFVMPSFSAAFTSASSKWKL